MTGNLAQLHDVKQRMNALGKDGQPFLFLFDFDRQCPEVWTLNEVASQGVRFQLPGLFTADLEGKDLPDHSVVSTPLLQRLAPYPLDQYSQQFNQMMVALRRGDTYLVNLTCQTPISLTTHLDDVYEKVRARYKLKYKDLFVCFSPETFVRINNGVISTYPMKGTIDASLPNARECLLANVKEKAEHSTVVDLLRNDLSQVATNVTVENFRYVEEVVTDNGKLLQVSSRIVGKLPADYQAHIGDIIAALLPAGSVTGAPKEKTVELINAVETYKRGYYTGVFGVFDGRDLDSAVLIRFIERTSDGWVYKSGGGLTAMSRLEEEYEEMQLKVYVPVY
ncbi:MAG: aminodeoxychorismate synthase component I [Bacteroidales bacterium]|jgi:para-aminobenzoate synthetase component I|nr:aminodeoxychorismate synthase component I [Bacteroidales bacterium]